jgi:heme-degrading monooxygenase HmoA
MTYIFMAVHYPQPERREQVYQGMKAMADQPELLEIGPWLEHGGERVVGLSRWESREAFEAAMPGSGVPGDAVHEGESRPREYVHLDQPQEEAGQEPRSRR